MAKHLIDTQDELDELCRNLAREAAIGVDTEFLRVKTYYPKLALVQIATPGGIHCVDPLSGSMGLEPLWSVLTDPEIVKVMHAARQDIEVLLHTAGAIPGPLFDTQIAAGLLGRDEQVGYARLVEEEFGTALPKGSQRTDWTRRPLSEAQLGYAENDVRYLLPLYERMRAELAEQGRLEWALEDFERIRDPALYETSSEDAYRRVGRGAHLDPDGQHVLKALCTWRERTARERNLPRGWVVDDEALIAIAAGRPESTRELAVVEGVRPRVVREHGAAILACTADTVRGEEAAVWARREALTAEQKTLRGKLIETVRKRAGMLGIAESVLVTRADLTRIARGVPARDVLDGWRWDVIGMDLEAVAGIATAQPRRAEGVSRTR